jgi:hypothetical protein
MTEKKFDKNRVSKNSGEVLSGVLMLCFLVFLPACGPSSNSKAEVNPVRESQNPIPPGTPTVFENGGGRTEGSQGLTEAEVDQAVNQVTLTMKHVISALPLPLKYKRYVDTKYNFFSPKVTGFNGLTLEIDGPVKAAAEKGLKYDGLLTLICHEIGHVAGGIPSRDFIFRNLVFSVEGQADYFATSVCLPAVMKDDDNSGYLSILKQNSEIEEFCKNETTEKSKSLCVRIVLASLNAATYFHKIWDQSHMKKAAGPTPSIGERDSSTVVVTNENHPIPQCRLDTYLLGFKCRVKSGTVSYVTDPTASTFCEISATDVARPACWYRK